MQVPPPELYYTKEHEWILVEEGMVTIGITDYAQGELGDVVFVEFPEIGEDCKLKEAFGSVESVKAVSEVYNSLSGEVTEINKILIDSPEMINEDPYGKGWLIRIRPSNLSELNNLMAAQEYTEYLAEELEE